MGHGDDVEADALPARQEVGPGKDWLGLGWAEGPQELEVVLDVFFGPGVGLPLLDLPAILPPNTKEVEDDGDDESRWQQ